MTPARFYHWSKSESHKHEQTQHSRELSGNTVTHLLLNLCHTVIQPKHCQLWEQTDLFVHYWDATE